MKLWPYQKPALVKLNADLQKNTEVLLQAIMGSGKTVIACALVERYFHSTNRKFLILAHKQELVSQFEQTFRKKTSVPFYDIGICCASLKQWELGKRVTIGTVQTFVNQISDCPDYHFLIIDESHRVEIGTGSQYDQILESIRRANPKLRILGLTATPFRMGHGYTYGKSCAGKNLFPKLNYQIKYSELKDSGYLMKLEAEIAINSRLPEDMASVMTRGDYVIDQASDVMCRSYHLSTAVEGIREYCSDFHHICCFCCDIQHAELLAEKLGEEATTIHSKLSDLERYGNMEAWKTGRKRIITSVNILVEGFDWPELDCLVMARPTLSPVLFLQGIGRVLRISEGKKRAFLLDLTENSLRFGTDLDNIRVTVPRSVSVREKAERPKEKQCPKCDEWTHVARMFCPNCNFEFNLRAYEDSKEKPETKNVVFGEPVEWEVNKVTWGRHTPKSGKPDSLRVKYHNKNMFFSEICSTYLCFDHGGYATTVARKWWEEHTYDHADDIPSSVDEALEMIETVIKPIVSIVTKKQGQYERIIRINHPPEPEPEPETFFKLPAREDFDDDIPF